MSGMPPPPPRPPGSASGDLRRAALLAGVAGAQHSRSPSGLAEQQAAAAPRDTSLPLPLPWSNYFDRQLQVHCPDRQATFNVYTAGTSGPVVLCLHGGGYTGLTWSLLAQRLKGSCRIVAPDLRSHGLTSAADEADLSAATLAADTVSLWRAMFGGGDGGSSGCGASDGSKGGSSGAAQGQAEQQHEQGRQQQEGQQMAREQQPTVLVGHSMGGAVAVHAAASKGIASLAGIVVVDVVEGTALASLPYMSAVLAKRPQRFASLRQAVDWALDSGMCKRQEAAHVSLPSMLRQEQAGEAQQRVAGSSTGAAAAALSGRPLTASGLEALVEGEEDEEGEAASEAGGHGAAGHAVAQQPQQPAPAAHPDVVAGSQQQLEQQQQGQSGQQQQGAAGRGWVWRTNLAASAPHWEGWYTGLSDLFLSLPAPKVLVLVGTDRLDRELTIGQMQGKFQPVLLPQAGHAVHEDEPERTADAIATFIKRFRIGEPPLQIPRPAAGLKPVLPVPIGPAFVGRVPAEHQQQ